MTELLQSAEKSAQFLKLIANTNRLMILYHLVSGEANVGQLEKYLGVSQPALSQHLARMRQEGMLTTRRRGQQIFYSIQDERILTLLNMMDVLFDNKQEPTLVKNA